MDILEEPSRISVITKRERERKLNVQKQRTSKESLSAKNEQLDYFQEEFMKNHSNIESLLNSSSNVDINELPNHFNTISHSILTLQKYVAASNLFLRSYDIKKCNESLQELTNSARELEDKLLPKKKFGFKHRLKGTQIKTSNGNCKDEPDFQRKELSLEENICGFSNRNGETLVLLNEEIFKRNVTFGHLEDCKVHILGAPSTLHLNSLKNCLILSGPVSTSIFAANCENCTLVIACQQLRLHTSKNLKIYLHVTSRAIMEDSTDISVAPYNFNYDGIKKDFDNSGLDVYSNHWDTLDDFNWLNVAQHSPNWQILPDSDREESWEA